MFLYAISATNLIKLVKDASDSYIIDPQIAERDYTDYDENIRPNYEYFLGYYAVTPWNNMYSSNGTAYYWYEGTGNWTYYDILIDILYGRSGGQRYSYVYDKIRSSFVAF